MEYHLTMRGHDKGSIQEYFLGKGGVATDGNTVISEEWQVWTGSQKIVRLGSLSFPEVEVKISHEGEDAEAFIQEFKMRFLTAGG